ncbi:MAG: GFA family protein [Hyphomicrobiales bacterium]
MSAPKSGSCLCGAISYEVNGPLRDVIACHCTQCRKASGHHVAATSCADEDITITGDTLVWYQSSDRAERGFCSMCGSNLFWKPRSGGRTSIFAGTLDGETGLKMVSQLYTEDKGDYYEIPDVPEVQQTPIK